MNFGEKENFFVKHRYFFQNYYFKFEGLEPDAKCEFENIVKQLSGVICDDADYILVESIYFKNNPNRTDLYSISYIFDSMKARRPLNISDYKFKLPEKPIDKSPCCIMAKHILRTDSCSRYYYDNVSCQKCSKASGLADPFELPFQIEIEDSSNSSDSFLKINNKEKTIHKRNHISDSSNNDSDSSENEVFIVQHKKHHVPDALDAVNNKTYKKIKFDKDSSSNSSDEEEESDIGPQSLNLLSNKDWWCSLPDAAVLQSVFKGSSYKQSNGRRGQTFNQLEQRIILSYLISKKKIQNGNSREPFNSMIEEGYLTHRTVESLFNNFRRVIMPKIHTFKLPKVLEKDFIMYNRR